MFIIEITKEDILKRINEEDLWKYYISSFKEIGKPFSSELREDKHPSCNIFVSNNNRLLYKDFSYDKTYDIFEYIKEKYSCNYQECLNIIINDFSLDLKNDTPLNTPVELLKYKETKVNSMKNEQTIIKVKTRNWSLKDKLYWEGRYCVKKTTLVKYKVFPLELYTIYKNNERYDFKPKSLCYGYWFGGDYWKIYQPYEAKGENKHINNHNFIFGLNQLPNNSSKLIITSSPKDVLVWKTLGFWSISPISESFNFDNELILNLKERFKKIYINYDNDEAGKLYTNKLTNKYPFLIPFFTSDEAKDISDLIELKKDKKIILNNLNL